MRWGKKARSPPSAPSRSSKKPAFRAAICAPDQCSSPRPTMAEQLDLLSYPESPGYRARATSKAAADSMASRAGTLRADALRAILHIRCRPPTKWPGFLGESVLAIPPARATEPSSPRRHHRQRHQAPEHQRPQRNRVEGRPLSETLLNGKVELHCGDMTAVLPTLAENSIDSCVCATRRIIYEDQSTSDLPPKDETKQANALCGWSLWPHRKRLHGQAMGWRRHLYSARHTGARLPRPKSRARASGHFWRDSRTYHRLAAAIEDAGSRIRDQIQWVYGSGFAKSRDPWRLDMK